MKRVAYGGESFITSDDGADALLDFAALAAMSGVAEVVTMPAVGEDGRVISVNLVIGPSSELITSPVETTTSEPDTVDAAAVIRARAAQIGASSTHTRGEALSGGYLASPDSETGDPELY